MAHLNRIQLPAYARERKHHLHTTQYRCVKVPSCVCLYTRTHTHAIQLPQCPGQSLRTHKRAHADTNNSSARLETNTKHPKHTQHIHSARTPRVGMRNMRMKSHKQTHADAMLSLYVSENRVKMCRILCQRVRRLCRVAVRRLRDIFVLVHACVRWQHGGAHMLLYAH